MKVFQQWYGLFKKEFVLHSDSRLALLNRLLIGPVISLASTGILYSGFFSHHPQLTLAGMSGENYISFVLFGFLVHTYLNSGYYFFSSKLLGEWSERTLPLLWMAPCNRIVLLFSLCSMEVFRSLFISLIAIAVLGLPHGSPMLVLVQEGILMLTLMSMGMAMGFLRSGMAILNLGKAEFIDNFYLLFIFTACPYIPKLLLPVWMQRLCELNPVYYGIDMMRMVWRGEGVAFADVAIISAGLITVTLLAYIALRLYRVILMEYSFN